jgi:hypothetical protein
MGNESKKQKSKSKMKIFVLLAGILLLSSCGIYSFNGATVDPNLKTVTVRFFQNNAQIVVPSLSQSFTEKLRDKFINETNLSLTDQGGDLEFKGAITTYAVSGVAPTGNETTALSRLTITVSVEFINRVDDKQGWKHSFSRYEDFESNVSLNSVEEQLIALINHQLAEDIFNKALVNW